jgi:hypothetical protein
LQNKNLNLNLIKKKIIYMEMIFDILVVGVPEELFNPIVILTTGLLALLRFDPTRDVIEFVNDNVIEVLAVALFYAFAYLFGIIDPDGDEILEGFTVFMTLKSKFSLYTNTSPTPNFYTKKYTNTFIYTKYSKNKNTNTNKNNNNNNNNNNKNTYTNTYTEKYKNKNININTYIQTNTTPTPTPTPTPTSTPNTITITNTITNTNTDTITDTNTDTNPENYGMNSKYAIFIKIRNKLNRQKYKAIIKPDGELQKAPDIKVISKQIFSSLTDEPLHSKQSLLTRITMDYFNSIHPNKFRSNFEAPTTSKESAEVKGLMLKPKNNKITSKTNALDDVIYEYLKTFSKYSKNKNGLILKYNQQIAYSFSNKSYKNITVGDGDFEALINNYLNLNLKTNINNQIQDSSLNIAAPLNAIANVTENINKNKFDLLNKQSLSPNPETIKFPPFSKTKLTANQKSTTPSRTGILSRTPMKLGVAVANQPELMQLTELTKLTEQTQKIATVAPAELNSIENLLLINELKAVSAKTVDSREGNNIVIKNSYNLLFYFFKSMYCLISKPVFLFTPDKVVIELFYYLNIPKFKVFK